MQANLELISDNFKLTFNKKLLSPVKFQLKHYGFKEINIEQNKENEEYLAKKENIKINNILEYLKENNIKIILCPLTQDIINNINLNKKKFLNKIENLKKIKENISDNDLTNFSKSLGFLKRNLLDYQIKSCYHLFNSQSAANFSVPGSGKTSVVLAYYEKLRLEKKVDAIFLIGPKNCFYSWDTEFFETLGRKSKLLILDKDIKFEQRLNIYKNSLKSEIYAFHFSTASNDIEYLKNFANVNNFLLVIDEAHNIKKIGGKWANAILQLSKLSSFKVILTGTPMPNQHRDFYNYLDFLYGENEILSLQDKAKIEVLIERNNLIEASKILKNNLKPFYVRITKKDLNLSKPNFNTPVLVKMNPIEKKIHDIIISKMQSISLEEFKDKIDLLEKILRARTIRLRQVCSYVKNLLTALPQELKNGDENLAGGDDIASLIHFYDKKEKPAKIFALKSLLIPLVNKKKKVLIWSTHLKSIELIKNELLKDEVNIKVITGSTKLNDREDIKNAFNDKNSNLDVIVANPQACSESISLHKACQNSIYYDLNYNTAEFLQSLDRIHRVGGSETNPVYYDFLQYENSIDEKIYKRVFEKANRQMKVIEEDNLIFDINQEDDVKSLYNDLKI